MTSTAAQPLALLYVRVSTGRQAREGHSLESQPAILKTAAEAAGYAVEIVAETGSGRNASRPALLSALARLKSGEASALYAVDVDRLARSTIHLIEIANAAHREGWRLVITSADVDSSTPAGEMFLTMAAAFAQYESRMVSARVKRQHEARRDRGEIWGATTGPRSPLPAETVTRMLDLRAEGLTLRAIADTLTAEGIPTARGGQWAAATVRAVLNSPAVLASA
jgi:DNA invertase Pin-like site-specific DNA recombinase